GFGEGQPWIGSDSLSPTAAGNASWDFASNSVYPANIWITNTAEGALNSGVSEVSRAYKVYIPGDLNVDGFVNNLDIAPFVQLLTSPGTFAASYPDTPAEAGDINDDGMVNNLDIAPFVALLTGSRPTATRARPEAQPVSLRSDIRDSTPMRLGAELRLTTAPRAVISSGAPERSVVRVIFTDDRTIGTTTTRAPVRANVQI
ncbi:MAG TPA: dockerin type I domain-containing protein, partial [Tepidisphaeraceae bacterium]|nr:dockerin type I domain-containing protein [Tepidisphaeraceae bacterium]